MLEGMRGEEGREWERDRKGMLEEFNTRFNKIYVRRKDENPSRQSW